MEPPGWLVGESERPLERQSASPVRACSVLDHLLSEPSGSLQVLPVLIPRLIISPSCWCAMLRQVRTQIWGQVFSDLYKTHLHQEFLKLLYRDSTLTHVGTMPEYHSISKHNLGYCSPPACWALLESRGSQPSTVSDSSDIHGFLFESSVTVMGSILWCFLVPGAPFPIQEISLVLVWMVLTWTKGPHFWGQERPWLQAFMLEICPDGTPDVGSQFIKAKYLPQNEWIGWSDPSIESITTTKKRPK